VTPPAAAALDARPIELDAEQEMQALQSRRVALLETRRAAGTPVRPRPA